MLGIDPTALSALDPAALPVGLADKMIENVVGVLGMPVGIGLNLMVNGRDHLVPMAIEEPSVVAAFSHASKIARSGGGFVAEADPSLMIGQVQLCPRDQEEADRAVAAIVRERAAIEAEVRASIPQMESRGGGLRSVETRKLVDPEGGPPMVIVHLVIDVLDAMGANVVNHAAEAVAPTIGRITGLEVNLRILSNLAARRLARARVSIPVEALGGLKVAQRIAAADRFARLDPYRAATHNKGLLNGIDAVAIATGNDWRGIEAGAHAWAARSGQYRGLTRWEVEDQALVGAIELPLAVGTVGGSTRCHPTIALLRQLLGVRDARELASVLAAVGLAQNLAALRALATEGIQRGHMELHARQIALAAGAAATEVDRVVGRLVELGRITLDAAAAEIERHRQGRAAARD